MASSSNKYRKSKKKKSRRQHTSSESTGQQQAQEQAAESYQPRLPSTSQSPPATNLVSDDDDETTPTPNRPPIRRYGSSNASTSATPTGTPTNRVIGTSTFEFTSLQGLGVGFDVNPQTHRPQVWLFPTPSQSYQSSLSILSEEQLPHVVDRQGLEAVRFWHAMSNEMEARTNQMMAEEQQQTESQRVLPGPPPQTAYARDAGSGSETETAEEEEEEEEVEEQIQHHEERNDKEEEEQEEEEQIMEVSTKARSLTSSILSDPESRIQAELKMLGEVDGDEVFTDNGPAKPYVDLGGAYDDNHNPPQKRPKLLDSDGEDRSRFEGPLPEFTTGDATTALPPAVEKPRKNKGTTSLPATISKSMDRAKRRKRSKISLAARQAQVQDQAQTPAPEAAKPTATLEQIEKPQSQRLITFDGKSRASIEELEDAWQFPLRERTRGWWSSLDDAAKTALVTDDRYPKLIVLYRPEPDWFEVNFHGMDDIQQALVKRRIEVRLPSNHHWVILTGPKYRGATFESMLNCISSPCNPHFAETLSRVTWINEPQAGPLSLLSLRRDQDPMDTGLQWLHEYAKAGRDRLKVWCENHSGCLASLRDIVGVRFLLPSEDALKFVLKGLDLPKASLSVLVDSSHERNDFIADKVFSYAREANGYIPMLKLIIAMIGELDAATEQAMMVKPGWCQEERVRIRSRKASHPWDLPNTVISTHSQHPVYVKAKSTIRQAYLQHFQTIANILSAGELKCVVPAPDASAIGPVVQDRLERSLSMDERRVLEVAELLKLDLTAHVFLTYDPEWDQDADDTPIRSGRGAARHNWELMIRRINENRGRHGLPDLPCNERSLELQCLNNLLGVFLPHDEDRIAFTLIHLFCVLWPMAREQADTALWTSGKTMVTCGLLLEEVQTWLEERITRPSADGMNTTLQTSCLIPQPSFTETKFNEILHLYMPPKARVLRQEEMVRLKGLYEACLEWYGEWWHRSGLIEAMGASTLKLEDHLPIAIWRDDKFKGFLRVDYKEHRPDASIVPVVGISSHVSVAIRNLAQGVETRSQLVHLLANYWDPDQRSHMQEHWWKLAIMLHHLKSLEGPNPADDDPSLLAPEEQDTESPAEDAEAAPVEVVNENSNVVDPEQERLAKERGEDLIREIEQEYVELQAKRQRKAKRRKASRQQSISESTKSVAAAARDTSEFGASSVNISPSDSRDSSVGATLQNGPASTLGSSDSRQQASSNGSGFSPPSSFGWQHAGSRRKKRQSTKSAALPAADKDTTVEGSQAPSAGSTDARTTPVSHDVAVHQQQSESTSNPPKSKPQSQPSAQSFCAPIAVKPARESPLATGPPPGLQAKSSVLAPAPNAAGASRVASTASRTWDQMTTHVRGVESTSDPGELAQPPPSPALSKSHSEESLEEIEHLVTPEMQSGPFANFSDQPRKRHHRRSSSVSLDLARMLPLEPVIADCHPQLGLILHEQRCDFFFSETACLQRNQERQPRESASARHFARCLGLNASAMQDFNWADESPSQGFATNGRFARPENVPCQLEDPRSRGSPPPGFHRIHDVPHLPQSPLHQHQAPPPPHSDQVYFSTPSYHPDAQLRLQPARLQPPNVNHDPSIRHPKHRQVVDFERGHQHSIQPRQPSQHRQPNQPNRKRSATNTQLRAPNWSHNPAHLGPTTIDIANQPGGFNFGPQSHPGPRHPPSNRVPSPLQLFSYQTLRHVDFEPPHHQGQRARAASVSGKQNQQPRTPVPEKPTKHQAHHHVNYAIPSKNPGGFQSENWRNHDQKKEEIRLEVPQDPQPRSPTEYMGRRSPAEFLGRRSPTDFTGHPPGELAGRHPPAELLAGRITSTELKNRRLPADFTGRPSPTDLANRFPKHPHHQKPRNRQPIPPGLFQGLAPGESSLPQSHQ